MKNIIAVSAFAALATLISTGASAGGYEDTFLHGDPFSWCHSTPIGKMSEHDMTMCEGTLNFENSLREARRQEAAHPSTEEDRCYAALPEFRDGCVEKIDKQKLAARAASHSREPTSINLCPPPHKMTDNGCR
jgi:hypothetical protein